MRRCALVSTEGTRQIRPVYTTIGLKGASDEDPKAIPLVRSSSQYHLPVLTTSPRGFKVRCDAEIAPVMCVALRAQLDLIVLTIS